MATKAMVSLDAKTLRVIRTGVGALGRIADDFLVYERQ